MFDKNIRQICINVYNQLSKYNIKGIEKKQFITNTFNLHINSLYNWIKKDTKINNNKYLNIKIDLLLKNLLLIILTIKLKFIKLKKILKIN